MAGFSAVKPWFFSLFIACAALVGIGCGGADEPAKVAPAAAASQAAPVAESPLTTPGADGGVAQQQPGPVGPPLAPPTELPTTPGPTNGFQAIDGSWITPNDAFFLTRMQAAGAPGASMVVVKDTRVLWSKGYGYADITAGRPATPDTLFMLASISKTIAGVALMQLLEKSPYGLGALDFDVHAAGLPFAVRNPDYPDVPITFRQLLTHTSSLVDGPFFNDFRFVQGDSTIPLANFLATYVQDPQNWAYRPPGYEYEYSNSGATLVGYLVERLSGMSLEQYCQQFVFAPLGMVESSWFIGGLDPSHVAMPYEFENGFYYPQGHYGFPDYPDGQLRTSASQLARFLMMSSGDGSLGAERLVQPVTIGEMKRPQAVAGQDQGLVYYGVTAAGRRFMGHNGAYYGVSTDMWFDPVTRAGYVMLTNGGAYMSDDTTRNAAMTEMNEYLAQLALAAK